MSDKFFPIKTDTACQLKWNWSTIRLDTGITRSCHRVNSDILTVDTFDQFHNTPKKIADRKLMLNGMWPDGCEYCKNIEDSGGYSDRMLHLTIPNQSPPELEHDLTATVVTPRIVEIYFDNMCNMSCIYCSDGFSSKIQQENINYGRFDLTASIDCFGAEQEYVRYGLDLEQWKRNFEYVCGQKWIKVKINQTLSALTTKTVPDLLKYINNLRADRKIGHYFSTTSFTHDCLHPKIFGAGFFDNDFENILQSMPSELEEQITARKYMQGIQKEINLHARDQEKINQLGIFLDEIDRRRNLDWKQTFPWLVKELTNVV